MVREHRNSCPAALPPRCAPCGGCGGVTPGAKLAEGSRRPPHLARWSPEVYGSTSAQPLSWRGPGARPHLVVGAKAETGGRSGYAIRVHRTSLLSTTPQVSGTGKWLQQGLPSCPSPKPVQNLRTRFYVATRLSCLVASLPAAISQPAAGSVDELLITTVAGCAGEASSMDI